MTSSFLKYEGGNTSVATINNEALDSLTNTIVSLLAEAADPTQLTLTVNPLNIIPTGIGGFVSFNEDPSGEILGTRVEAIVVVSVKAENVDNLKDMVNVVIRALMGVERKILLEFGLLNISLHEIGSKSIQKQGSKKIAEQDLKFKVLYEFLKRPQEAEGLIREIPINIDES